MSASKDRISPNLNAFLDMLGHSEGTIQIPGGEDGYLVIVGSTMQHPILMHGFTDHPRRKITLRPGLVSTAAGRYQIIEGTWDWYKHLFFLPDFSPMNQDRVAEQLLAETGALSLIESGWIDQAIFRASSRWASLPDTPTDQRGRYDQGAHPVEGLVSVYKSFGGSVA